MSGTVYGGLVFVETCRSHPEQYDVIAEGGHEVGYIHYRRGWLTVGGHGYLEDMSVDPLLLEQRDSSGEWPGNRIDDDKREAWLTEAAALIHADMRRQRVSL